MLFLLVKAYARLALWICCRKIIVNKPALLSATGPLLLACNHPNSFLDGIILTTLFQENIYLLARGDAFRTPWHGRVLRWLHLLPVYRTSEGVENLEYNYATFKACKEVFKNNGIVIIFSEGRCVNEWRIRPLKKGTARLATASWEEGLDVAVLPVGINYNPFRNFGKNVLINFGQPLNKAAVMQHRTDGKMYLTFNNQLKAGLKQLVVDINPADKVQLKKHFSFSQPVWKRLVLLLPATLGFLLHALYYFAARALTKTYFDNDHFDSALVALLALAYPLYLLLLAVAAGVYSGWIGALLLVVLLPLCAWSFVQLKPQI